MKTPPGIKIILAATLLGASLLSAEPVFIDTVTVGNAGNASDVTGFGAVDYDYHIGTVAVTNAQYAAFLNTVASSDPHGLWNREMGTNPRGGISRRGSPGSYTYRVRTSSFGFNAGQSMAEMPVNFVSFWSAARFANWLTSGDTETGMYELTSEGIANNTVTRDTTAWANGGVAITSEDEWYKAAYYDPTRNGGDGGYWQFPTRSNATPTAENPPGGANSANFRGSGGAAVGTVTAGGAYTDSSSYYGTFDQGGNVAEWNESIMGDDDRHRGQRGGAFTSDERWLKSDRRASNPPTRQDSFGMGFRVSSLAPIPEPANLAAIPTADEAVARADVDAVTNSIGMEIILVEPGSFMMGSEEVYKENPVHKVHITQPFRMSATQVTNEQYEQFDPEHRKLRGKFGLSNDDDEAVIFVSWHDAVAFCEWLSEKEGIPYRLPTEAEWEYAARAGTTTQFNTGDTLLDEFYRNQRAFVGAQPVPLHVGQTTPNAWGLHDMHGLVEEWVSDWYGPYTAEEKTDPVGRADGLVKVTRGGSHGVPVEYLRSATRLGTLPEDKSWLIGFRVVQAEPLATEPLPPEPPRRWAQEVGQEPHEWHYIEEPYFQGPIPFVNIPRGSLGPLYCDFTIRSGHVNHVPGVTWAPNGDLIAAWFSTLTGRGSGRMMTTAASRLKAGSEEWLEADVFFNAPGRNQTGTSLFQDEDGILYWYNGLSAGKTILHNNALIMSKSADSGATWSRPKVVYGDRNDPINAVTIMDNITMDVTLPSPGKHVLFTDNNSYRLRGGSTALMFIDPEDGEVTFSEGQIAGIHATAVQLEDGSMLAVGRGLIDRESGEGIEGLDKSKMPMSVSRDGGNTWEYRDSEFPAIGGGQRNVLMRLEEGPLLLVSFTHRTDGMLFEDQNGETFRGYGMFAALSFDDGRTWPHRKLITPADGEEHEARGIARKFRATHTQAEPRGYLTATQTPDGVVHLLSSGLHYRFNLAWLQQHSEPVPPPPSPEDFESKVELERVFQARVLPTADGWRFTGSDVSEEEAVEVVEDTLRITTGRGQRVRWADHSAEGFGAARGAHTAEITMRVTRSTSARRGIDFETYVPGIGRAFIAVTAWAVCWFEGGAFEALAEGLDNASRMHTYRLAVDPEGNVGIFRDGTLLGVKQATSGRDNIGTAADAYLQWGNGARGSEADAIVERVAFDLQGAFRPGE